ncbi:hypothetical protein IW15_19685 [Chryseobacterium soli]|uniref:N-acetyltransferase domain-containing protein n=1 Tax=Chryseobacterium soli TaxID=445961 RepID=A0A086A1J8_9FLAO|nr:GNAT family N-acetyltransferase [Chryseobacterium soli]KFF10562.1 hypothetical protein IW15_19685 [Chryseobacterium soli]
MTNAKQTEVYSNLSIKTHRLILRPIHENDIDDINNNFTPKVTEFMPFNPTGDKNEVIHFVESSKKGLIMKTDIVFVILDHKEQFIGCCGIHNINPVSVEVGLWLKEDSQSQGFGSEVIISLIAFIERYFSIEYIMYPVDKENVRSRKIPEKLGFTAFKTYTKQRNESANLDIIEYRKCYTK